MRVIRIIGLPMLVLLGLAAGTSAARASECGYEFQAAFQVNTGLLYTVSENYATSASVILNHGQGMRAATSPSIAPLPKCGSEIAFQANTGVLLTTGQAGNTNWNLGMMPGTSPSITALPGGGYEVAFQSNTGQLWTVGTAGGKDWELGMAPGTSPSISALPVGGYIVAFQANTNKLWTTGTIGTENWELPMMAGTSPSVTGLTVSPSLKNLPGRGFEIAYQGRTGDLYTVGNVPRMHGAIKDWELGMMPGTSPSITAPVSLGGEFEVAFQANTGDLWTVGSTEIGAIGNLDWKLGMLLGSSPAIAPLRGHGFEAAFQANTSYLYTVGSGVNKNWLQGMMAGTSPSITPLYESEEESPVVEQVKLEVKRHQEEKELGGGEETGGEEAELKKLEEEDQKELRKIEEQELKEALEQELKEQKKREKDKKVFAECPVGGVAEGGEPDAYCVSGSTTTKAGGYLRLGYVTVPLIHPLTLQYGLAAGGEGLEPYVAPTGVQPLTSTPEAVPGELLAHITADEQEELDWPEGLKSEYAETQKHQKKRLKKVSETVELDGTPATDRSLLQSGEGPGLSLPVLVAYESEWLSSLGDACTLGSSDEPITLSLTSGASTSALQEVTIDGSPGQVEALHDGEETILADSVLVDNTFAVPAAVCAGPYSEAVAATLDRQFGVPSPAGSSAAELQETLYTATAKLAKADGAK
jgi:hypothetical protein